ncbi:MAG TPA: flagellar assembly protein H [Oscillatoriales cyanobacterium M59_W2019_021]|nr:flagellar assembly protein H [Oscillatoriales cyanobacterium M4454_W2019_049]HIK53008.1 flagellar assembly protein H [Oscillatoriales cyanobacterium M59_W2019_021]
MTRFLFDRFAKDYLKELLSPLGEVKISDEVRDEVRQIDVRFTPTSTSATSDWIQQLGLLGRMVSQPALFEPFRNPATVSEIRGCMTKLFNVCAGLERRAKRQGTPMQENDYPMLWILTPTLSETQLQAWGASVKMEEGWLSGVYFLAPSWRTAIVVVHQLPTRAETLWLRMLGKGNVQKRAVEELKTLPENNSVRTRCLEFLFDLQATLEANKKDRNPQIEVNDEDEEFFMAVGSLFQEQLNAAEQRGIEQGIERGRSQGKLEGVEEGLKQGVFQGQRLILENLLQVKFGNLDPIMPVLIERMSVVSSEQFTLFLLQLSRVENDETSRQTLPRLFVEEILKFRWGEAEEGEDRESTIRSILSLSPEALTEILSLLNSRSKDEILSAIAQQLPQED